MAPGKVLYANPLCLALVTCTQVSIFLQEACLTILDDLRNVERATAFSPFHRRKQVDTATLSNDAGELSRSMGSCLGTLADLNRHVVSITLTLEFMQRVDSHTWLAMVPECEKDASRSQSRAVADAAQFLQHQIKAIGQNVCYYQERARTR
jgi:hypothetical protein